MARNIFDKIDDYNKRGQYKEARELAEYGIYEEEGLSEQNYCRLYFAMGESYEKELQASDDESEYDSLRNKAFDYFKRASEYADDVSWKSLCFEAMADNCGQIRARRYLMAAMCDPDRLVDVIREYNASTKLMFGFMNEYVHYQDPNFNWDGCTREEKEEALAMAKEDSFVSTNEEYGLSPYIFIAQDVNHMNGCYDPTDTIFWVFTKNMVPEELSFPCGHPIANTLYIPHPLHPTLYLPIEQAEQMLFIDKVREFCYIAQCLGAKKIEFFSASGQKLSSYSSTQNHVDATVNVKVHNISGSYSDNYYRDANSNCEQEINMNQTFEPTKAPYCPEDVEWYQTEKAWKDLVRQRMSGNILHYDISISSQETTNVSESEERSISAAYSNMIMRLNANYRTSLKRNWSKSEHKTWKISVDFASKAEISSNAKKDSSSPKPLTQEENEYIETFMEVVGDNEVTDRIRRILDRERQSLNISEKRAKELELWIRK